MYSLETLSANFNEFFDKFLMIFKQWKYLPLGVRKLKFDL